MAISKTIEILSNLIKFNTVSNNSNLELINYIDGYLKTYNIKPVLVYNHNKTKANLFATIGQTNEAGIILSGHTDTVPAQADEWRYPPFELSHSNGKYYGRGTADMKGFIACVLARVPDMVNSHLKRPFHLAFSHDEEIGCRGVPAMLKHVENKLANPPLISIIGEPTSMRLVTAHKGKIAFRILVQGKACHSGMAPEGVNAIHAAAQLISWIVERAYQHQHKGPFDERFSVPFTTMQAGVISGGTALNIVPDKCSFDVEIRNIPEDDTQYIKEDLVSHASKIEQEMQKHFPGASINFEELINYPGLATNASSESINWVRKLLKNKNSNTISFGSEAGLFSNTFNTPAIVCGPGSMDQGHKPDEYVSHEQLTECSEFLLKLIQSCSD